ncbi:MAG: tetratricopeptide repeat protein [Proteobacteria bacterium]|nr:tetratricopeptide repeat protein [Pseudomonadota bacterium]
MRRNLICLTVLAATGMIHVGPGTALAQRYQRKNLIRQVDVKQTERTKKLVPVKTKQQRPAITADEFIAIQGQVRHIRQAQVQQYELLIGDTDPDDPELPDLLFRLAEVHAQQQRYWHFRAMEALNERDQVDSAQHKSNLEKKHKNYLAASKKELLRAVKAYKRVADNPNFRNYPRMDMALYYYAYTLQNAKYASEARKILHRLIKDYPNSKFIPEAYLVFADYYFAQNSLANAERFYDKVLQFPKSSVYDFALYKKGWVYLNLKQAQDALETFFNVVERTRRKKKLQNLNRAAKKDFVRAYAEIGKPQRAFKAFKRVDQNYAFDMLQILGDIYLEQGKAPKAIYTFRELIRVDRKHKHVCDWQYNISHAMLTVGNQDQKVQSIENLVKLYVTYKERGILPEENLIECGENAEAMNSEMAKLWHNEALKTLNTETLAYVDKLYQLYLKSFPQSREYATMQYYYAELMWSRAENEKAERLAAELWEQAAVAFTDVVKSGKLKGEMLKQAAYAAVLGWKNALAVDPRTNAPPVETDDKSDRLPPPKEIAPRQMKMIAAFDVYIDYIKDPKDEELVLMKFLKARIYWRYNHFDKAIPLFEDVVKNHLDHETGEASANLLLDTLNRAQRYDEMLKWVDWLIGKKDFLADREDLAERLTLLKRQSMRKSAEKLEKVAKDSGDFSKYVDCGSKYLEIYNNNPEADDADVVLYNAGVCFEQGRSISAAIRMFNSLSKLFPDSKQTQRAIVRLGKNYAQIAWYDKAAERYETYARRFGGEKDAYKALNDAVFFRKGAGEDDLAIKDTEYFIKQYGKRKVKEASAAMFSMTGIYEKQGDSDKVIKHLRRYLKTYGRKGGIDRQIVAHAKIGMILWEQSCPVRGVDGACIKVKRERSIVRRGKKRKRRRNLPKQCGPESKIKITAVARDGRKVRAAQREFKQALKLFSRGSALRKVPGADAAEKTRRQAIMVKYLASAKFYMAEDSYEKFLAVKFPTKLDFDQRNARKRKKSLKAFTKWLKSKKKLASKLFKTYDDIKKTRDAHYAIAAAARAGQVSQNFSDALYTAEIPRDVRSGKYAEDKVDAYCDELTTQAEPLEKTSVSAYSFCLKLSTRLNWFNTWSRLCEKELGQIRPQEFPTAAELRSEPNNSAPVITVEGAVKKLE